VVRAPSATGGFVEPKKAYKSFHYKAKTTWGSARRGLLSVAGRPNIVVGSPPEFTRKTMQSVEEHCFIANSINSKVTLTPEFVVAPLPK